MSYEQGQPGIAVDPSPLMLDGERQARLGFDANASTEFLLQAGVPETALSGLRITFEEGTHMEPVYIKERGDFLRPNASFDAETTTLTVHLTNLLREADDRADQIPKDHRMAWSEEASVLLAEELGVAAEYLTGGEEAIQAEKDRILRRYRVGRYIAESAPAAFFLSLPVVGAAIAAFNGFPFLLPLGAVPAAIFGRRLFSRVRAEVDQQVQERATTNDANRAWPHQARAQERAAAYRRELRVGKAAGLLSLRNTH